MVGFGRQFSVQLEAIGNLKGNKSTSCSSLGSSDRLGDRSGVDQSSGGYSFPEHEFSDQSGDNERMDLWSGR